MCMLLFFTTAMFTIHPHMQPASEWVLLALLLVGTRTMAPFHFTGLVVCSNLSLLIKDAQDGRSWAQLARDGFVQAPARVLLRVAVCVGRCSLCLLRAFFSASGMPAADMVPYDLYNKLS